VLTTGALGGKSVDSLLASIDLMDPISILLEWNNQSDTAFINRYWYAAETFTHASYGGYLVTRLDGYTEADAKSLVDRALTPQSNPYYILMDIDLSRGLGDPTMQPRSILLPSGDINDSYELNYYDYNADMTCAAGIISGRLGLSTQLDSTNTFILSPYALTGYISWGSNDSHFSAAAYNGTRFAPGGIAETAVSTSGRTLLPTTGGQTLIAELVAQGASGVKGYVTEPFLDAVASPTILFDFYTSGRNLAESYYAASRFVGWKDIIIGDPLCCLRGTFESTIASAKAKPDGTLISLDNKIVSAGTDDFGDRFYIQEPDRSSGIQVYMGRQFSGIAEGMIVSIRGILTTRNGERIIINPSVIALTPPPTTLIKSSAAQPHAK
jgi:uncharacterized protein (TIGR03790 family)